MLAVTALPPHLCKYEIQSNIKVHSVIQCGLVGLRLQCSNTEKAVELLFEDKLFPDVDESELSNEAFATISLADDSTVYVNNGHPQI